jgi:hypothetical protein
MVGNVSEWCQDAYAKNYPGDGADERAIEGEADAPRVIRGGSWLDAPDFNRSAKRIGFPPQGRRDFMGFRVAATVESVIGILHRAVSANTECLLVVGRARKELAQFAQPQHRACRRRRAQPISEAQAHGRKRLL